MTANYTRTGPFTNGGAPGISASFLNKIEQLFAQVSGSTLVGKYWLQGGGNANGWDLTYYQTLYLSNASTPVSVSIDTADQAATASAGAPATFNLTAHGFLVMSVLTAVTNTARVAGNWTVTY